MTISLFQMALSMRLAAELRNTVGSRTARIQQGAEFTPAAALSSGTTENQANRIISAVGRSLTSGNNESIDLCDLATLDIGAGVGVDALGQSVALAEIVALLIVNDADSVGDLVIGGEGTTAAFNSIFNGSDTGELGPFGPGGAVMLFRPDDPAWAVADTSNHLLKIAAVGGDVTYDLHILGRDA